MKLYEFLKVCYEEDYVGIWNVGFSPLKKRLSKKNFEVRPTEQQYFKIKNIPYGRIMYFLDKDVMHINHTDKGFLVRIYDKERSRKSMDAYNLASEIAKAIRR